MDWNLTFNGHMIRNQVQLSEDISLVYQRFDGLESQIQTLIDGQQLIIGTINRTLKKDKRRAAQKPPKQKLLGQKNKQPSKSDVSRLLHLPEALQRNISKFTENVLFKTSNIPDDLISMECLSEDECSVISSKPSQKDQTRLLIRKIKARGPEVIEKFLHVIGKDHPELYMEVYKSLDEIVRKYKDKPECAICVMQYTVDLKDIADYLWEQKIITDNIYGDIIESESLYRSRPMIWSSIINSLNDFNDIGEAKAILINALTPKYEHIVKYINQNPDRPSLSCWCCRKSRRARPRPLVSEFGSQTDVSTTSAKLPKVLDDDNYSDDSQSVISSQGLQSSNLLSYELPEVFESMGNISFPQPEIQSSVIDSTTTVTNELTAENENSKRLNSESFVPQTDLNETQYLSSTLPEESSAIVTEAETKERQELKHSISTVSNTSTICAIHSFSSLGAADDTVPTNEMQILFQSELKDDENNSVFHDETDNDKFQDLNDETISTKESKADGIVKNFPKELTTDNGEEKDNTKAKEAEDIFTETTYTGQNSVGGETADKEEAGDKVEMEKDAREVAGDRKNGGEVAVEEDAGEVAAEQHSGEVADDEIDSREVAGEENAREVSAEQHSGEVADDEMDGGEVADEVNGEEVDKNTGEVDETDGGKVADEEDNQVSSTTFDHASLQQRKSSNRLTNTPQHAEKLGNVDDGSQVSSTSLDSQGD
ncbi:uncharacterized protein LOC123533977 [Mercenaria mercenaria]|uniref:uncharacterized protein LOC123533977 n=1 Tax=Mercenaria mercenaria TaxID=6596 RepID=UPI00234EADF7|nr:uncharacterized protein LOC123533977 [Mercenaria mercenaria]